MTTTQKKPLAKKANWVQAPTLSQTLLFFIAWMVGVGLLILAATDLFTESLFQRRHILIIAMILFSTLSTAKLIVNYFKQKRIGTR